MKAITITESELLEEIRRTTAVDDAPDDAMTVAELAQRSGRSRSTIAKRIQVLRDAGRVRSYRVRRYDDQGRGHPCTAYVLLAEAKPEKRKR